RLLRENSVLAGDREQRHLSLGHDALAPVAAAWDEEVQSGKRAWRAARRGLLQALGALALIAVVAGALLWRAESVARHELIKDSEESSTLAAEFAADKLPWKVRRYWKLLEQEALKKEVMAMLDQAAGPARGEMLTRQRGTAWATSAGKNLPAE